MNQIRTFSDVPVIFFTGKTDENTKKRIMKTNPVGYLTKPLDTTALKELISKTFHGEAG